MKKLSRVVIVGFPNVGKSTLFNRILGQRKALVHTDPGMTRDSQSAACVLEDKKFVLVDTGGLFGVADEPLSDKVREKALEEAAAADLVLFVLDGKRDVAEKFSYGSTMELAAVYAVVNTLAFNFKAVKKVLILVEGAEKETLGGHVDLTRAFLPDYSLVAR